MKALFDTSVLVSLVVNDRGPDAAIAWLKVTDDDLAISDFAWGEFVAAIGAKVRSGQLNASVASKLIESSRTRFGRWDQVSLSGVDVERAATFLLDFTLGLRLPDAIHIVIAQRIGSKLITADKSQGAAAAVLGIEGLIPVAS